MTGFSTIQEHLQFHSLNGMQVVSVKLPQPFSFENCLAYLNRNPDEPVHQIRDGILFKLIQLEGQQILMEIREEKGYLQIRILNGTFPEETLKAIALYIWQWFDLSRDLHLFHSALKDDPVIGDLTGKFRGLRLVGMPELFEALVWAITGQQINLTFAYKLKKQFVESFGESLDFDNTRHYLFPDPSVVSQLNKETLRAMQFSRQKAEYILGISNRFTSGELNKEMLLQMKDPDAIRNHLVSFRGIGNWTAEYVMMKCLQFPFSLPIQDVGLHNAIKNQLNMARKPSVPEIREMAKNWNGWESYVTMYLWQSLVKKL